MTTTKVVARVERSDHRVFEDRSEHKTFGDALRRYNELRDEIYNREQAGEIVDWTLDII